MASREVYDPRIAPVIRKPTAAPVNIYHAPGASETQQVVDALAELNPKLQQWSEVYTADYAKRQRAEGEQAARIHTEQALKAGDLTRMGELPMQDNPYFMAGYNEERGRVSAGVWQSDFKADVENDPFLKESVDLQDFDKAAGKHLEEWLKNKKIDRNLAFEKGFGHMKDQYLAMARLNFAEGIEKKLDVKSDEQLFASVKRTVTDNWGRDGITSTEIASTIDLIVDSAVKRGRPEGKARVAATMAVVAAAREAGPEKGLLILDLMKKTSGERGRGVLTDQSYGTKAYEETRKALIVEGQQEAERQRVEKQRAKQERIEQVTAGGFALLLKNPQANLESYLQQNPDAPPDVVGNLRSLQAQYQDLSYTTNKTVYRDLFQRVFDAQNGESPTSVHEVISKSRNHNLLPDDAHRLITMIESRDAAKKRGKDELDDRAQPYFRLAFSRLEDTWKDRMSGLVPAENVARVQYSRALLYEKWFDLKASGKVPEMPEKDLNQWFLDRSEEIVKMQQSELQQNIKFMPPTKPNIGGGGADAGTTTKVELPKTPVLENMDIINYQRGNHTRVSAKMAELGIPPEMAAEFVKSQLKLRAAAKKE